jgi:hypothetical protein
MNEQELCWRCPTPMAWVHGTWQCPRCRFKLGCCEGDPQTPCDVQLPDADSQDGGNLLTRSG